MRVQAGVKGAVLWRSSRPLRPDWTRPQPRARKESQSSFLRFLPIWGPFMLFGRSCFSAVRAFTKTNQARLSKNHLSMDYHIGSINHVFGPVLLHDFLFELPLVKGGDGVSNQAVGLKPHHWAKRTAPHANRAP